MSRDIRPRLRAIPKGEWADGRIRYWFYPSISVLPESYRTILPNTLTLPWGLLKPTFNRDMEEFSQEWRPMIVATHNGTPVGWIYTALGKNVMFYVNEHYRNRGIAYRMLIRWIENTGSTLVRPYYNSLGVPVARKVARVYKKASVSIVEAPTWET